MHPITVLSIVHVFFHTLLGVFSFISVGLSQVYSYFCLSHVYTFFYSQYPNPTGLLCEMFYFIIPLLLVCVCVCVCVFVVVCVK